MRELNDGFDINDVVELRDGTRCTIDGIAWREKMNEKGQKSTARFESEPSRNHGHICFRWWDVARLIHRGSAVVAYKCECCKEEKWRYKWWPNEGVCPDCIAKRESSEQEQFFNADGHLKDDALLQLKQADKRGVLV